MMIHTCVRQFLQLLLFIFFGLSVLFSQTSVPVSDLRAVALASQAIEALTNGTAVSDVALSEEC
jgi:hypothetical protein